MPLPAPARNNVKTYALRVLKPLLIKPSHFIGGKWTGNHMQLYIHTSSAEVLRYTNTAKAISRVCNHEREFIVFITDMLRIARTSVNSRTVGNSPENALQRVTLLTEAWFSIILHSCESK